MFCCGSDGLHLGMRGNIVQKFSQIVTLGDNSVLTNHDSPDGNFALLVRFVCFRQSLLHVDFIVFHRLFFLFCTQSYEKKLNFAKKMTRNLL